LKQKHRVREIIVSALQGQLENIDFAALSAKKLRVYAPKCGQGKTKIDLFRDFFYKNRQR
jgi:hypothetical protein